jgi:hypothetical protein
VLKQLIKADRRGLEMLRVVICEEARESVTCTDDDADDESKYPSRTVERYHISQGDVSIYRLLRHEWKAEAGPMVVSGKRETRELSE